MQGRQDLNLQPAVLETAALPIEPRPSALHRPAVPLVLGCTGAYSTDGWRSQASSGTPQMVKCKARRWCRTNGDGGPHPADRGSAGAYGSRGRGPVARAHHGSAAAWLRRQHPSSPGATRLDGLDGLLNHRGNQFVHRPPVAGQRRA